MRRYKIEIRGREFEIDVDELASNRYVVVVGTETYDVALTGDEDLPATRISPQLDLSTPQRDGPGARLPASPPQAAVAAAAPLAPRPASVPGRAARPGTATLTAPMPGVIVEVSVAVGVRVDRGDVVVVLDAMKMNNAIRAPRDGTVAEIFVDVGHPVAHGDPLVRFEAD